MLRMFAALATTCTLIVPLAGCGGAPDGQITFAVAVGDLPRSARERAFAQKHGPDDTLRLALTGERFDPPLELRAVPRDSVDRATPVAAEAAAFSAFKAADPDWIVETFADADRRDVLSFLADSAVRGGSQRLFESIERVYVYAVAEYRAQDVDYHLVFFSYRASPNRGNVHTYVREGGEWKRTNALARDTTVALALSAFRYGRTGPG